MSHVCIDSEGYELLHPDGTAAHEDCPCGGGGPGPGGCCNRFGICGFPEPPQTLRVAILARGSLSDARPNQNGIVERYEVAFDTGAEFDLDMGDCLRGASTDVFLVNDPRFSQTFPISLRLSVSVQFAFRQLVSSLAWHGPEVHTAGIEEVWAPSLIADAEVLNMFSGGCRVAWDATVGAGHTTVANRIAPGEPNPRILSGAAIAPSIVRSRGLCPVELVGAGSAETYEPATGIEATLSIELRLILRNAGACPDSGGGGGRLPPGIDPETLRPHGCQGCGG